MHIGSLSVHFVLFFEKWWMTLGPVALDYEQQTIRIHESQHANIDIENLDMHFVAWAVATLLVVLVALILA